MNRYCLKCSGVGNQSELSDVETGNEIPVAEIGNEIPDAEIGCKNPYAEMTNEIADKGEETQMKRAGAYSENLNYTKLPVRQSGRIVKMPAKFDEYDTTGMPNLKGNYGNESEHTKLMYMALSAAEVTEYRSDPKTVNEALNRPDSDKWKSAIAEAIEAHKKNETWEVVDKPNHKNVVDCKWVLKIKYNHDGSIERYKARLVAKGYSQIPGIDFNETFSPVVRYASLRILIAFATLNDWEIDQMDAVMAFVQGDLDEEIYSESLRALMLITKEI